jgi:hypothetical protein
LWQALPDLSNAEIMQLVRETASQYNTPDYLIGYGIPNLALALSQSLNVEEAQVVNQISVFPNPVESELHVIFPSSENQVRVVIYNILGKKVMEKSLDSSSTLDVSIMAKGVYLLNIETQNGSITKKIIKN